MRISSVPLAAVRSSTAKMAEAAWLSASGVSGAADARGDQQRGKQIAGAVRADRQFWRAHAPGALARSTASVSISPSGVSASSALVTTTVDGPRAINARAALIT